MKIRNIVLIFIICWAHMIKDVAYKAPMFSDQWWAEMIWWTKWVCCIGIDFPPIPIHMLKHRHSEIKVMELFPHNDSQAIEKFLKYSMTKEYDDYVIILRNVWSEYPDNELRKYNSVEYFKENCDLDSEYPENVVRPDGPQTRKMEKLGTILDNLNRTDALHALTFEFTLSQKEKHIHKAWGDLWNGIDKGLADRLIKAPGLNHHFLFHGNRTHTQIHAAFIAGYFHMIANSKQWKFAHKAYTPYLGGWKKSSVTPAIPFYRFADYPEPGIPHTIVNFYPGDLAYFGAWQYHEVVNNHHDRLGFGVGVRPTYFGSINGLLAPLALPASAYFSPLIWHTFTGIPFMVIQNTAEKMNKSPQHAGSDGGCEGRFGYPWARGFNGTQETRYDMKMVDGECLFVERELDYQKREVLGEWHPKEWHPRKSQTA